MVEVDVATEAIPVTIEGQTHELSLAIKDGRTRVSTRNIVVGKEAKLQLPSGFVLIRTKRLSAQQLLHDRFCLIIEHAFVTTFHLLYKAFCRGIVVGNVPTEVITTHLSVG